MLAPPGAKLIRFCTEPGSNALKIDLTAGKSPWEQASCKTVKVSTRWASTLCAKYLFVFLLSFPQNERKIYKLIQLNLSQFVYFLSTEPSMFTFTKGSIFKHIWLCAQKIQIQTETPVCIFPLVLRKREKTKTLVTTEQIFFEIFVTFSEYLT